MMKFSLHLLVLKLTIYSSPLALYPLIGRLRPVVLTLHCNFTVSGKDIIEFQVIRLYDIRFYMEYSCSLIISNRLLL